MRSQLLTLLLHLVAVIVVKTQDVASKPRLDISSLKFDVASKPRLDISSLKFEVPSRPLLDISTLNFEAPSELQPDISALTLELLSKPGLNFSAPSVGRPIRDDASRCPKGNCVHILQCPSVLATFREKLPVVCHFERLTPIICCLDSTEETSNPQQEISAPKVDFECGISAQKIVRFPFGGAVPFRKKRSLTEVAGPGLIPTAEPPVVGGQESIRNAWPWMALLGEKNPNGNIKWFCGGVLINKQWILTAAHCSNDITPNVIRLGEHDYDDYGDGAFHRDFEVAEIIPHPDYKRRQAYHDLELIKLATTVTIQTFIRPVCLPWGAESDKDMVDSIVKLTGWGDTEFQGNPSSALQEVDLTVFPISQCEQNYRNVPGYSHTWPQGIGEESLCVGYSQGGRDACQGDSGGPIVSRGANGRYTVAGIVSKGYGCGHPDYPGLYANVRHKPDLAWIKKTAF